MPTTLCLSRDFQNIFLDLNLDFKKLNSTKQDIFQQRNGFSFNGYKDFFESSLICAIELSQIVGDIKYQNGRWVIDIDNFSKKKWNKELIALPRYWDTINDWRNKVIRRV